MTLRERCVLAMLTAAQVPPDASLIHVQLAAGAMARALNAVANHLPNAAAYEEAIAEGLRMAALGDGP